VGHLTHYWINNAVGSLGLHQRLILKFNTKPLIQSHKTGVKPFLGLNWCKTLVLTSVLTWIFGHSCTSFSISRKGPARTNEHSQLRRRFSPTVWLWSISAIIVTVHRPRAPYLFMFSVLPLLKIKSVWCYTKLKLQRFILLFLSKCIMQVWF